MWSYNNANELYHWGILGMKWGIRRYQNKDGSLTDAGKKRVNKLASQYNKLTGKSIKKHNSEDYQTSKKTSSKNSTDNKNETKTNNKKSIKNLSDSDLNKLNSRIKAENEYYRNIKEYNSNHVSAGKKAANKVMDSIGKTVSNSIMDAGKNVLTDLITKIGREANNSLIDTYKDSKDPDSAIKKENSSLQLKLENYNLKEKVKEKEKNK